MSNIFYKYYFKYHKNREKIEKINLHLHILYRHIHNWTTVNKMVFWNFRGWANFQMNGDGKLFPYLVCEMIMLPSVVLVWGFFFCILLKVLWVKTRLGLDLFYSTFSLMIVWVQRLISLLVDHDLHLGIFAQVYIDYRLFAFERYIPVVRKGIVIRSVQLTQNSWFQKLTSSFIFLFYINWIIQTIIVFYVYF